MKEWLSLTHHEEYELMKVPLERSEVPAMSSRYSLPGSRKNTLAFPLLLRSSAKNVSSLIEYPEPYTE